jgi:alpha-beta hydrolase superfamily lysophospholipase
MNVASTIVSLGSLRGRQGGPRSGMRLFPLARWFAVAFASIYGATCLGVYSAQRYLVFEPDRTLHATPADYSFAVRDVGIVVPGEPKRTLHGWSIPAANPRAKVVLYLHGNDGNVSTSMDGIALLRELGYSVFMLDYRGYGASGGGFPSEAGVYQDAQSAWDYLVHDRGINPANLFIYGHSLGGAIAIELALRHPEAAGLVVESSFTSISDMATLEARYALLPVNLFLNQRFDSIAKVAHLRLPVLYIHGTADEIVPFKMGKALYDATPFARGFVAVPAGRHEDNAAAGGTALRFAIGRFVEGAVQSRAQATS